MVLKSPDKEWIEHSLRFGFKASNNYIEYKVVIARLELAKKFKAENISTFSAF